MQNECVDIPEDRPLGEVSCNNIRVSTIHASPSSIVRNLGPAKKIGRTIFRMCPRVCNPNPI